MKKAIVVLAAAAAMSSVASAQVVAVMNGRVHTVTGGVIENGDVIIRDGRIAQIGSDLQAPPDAVTIDATGKVVTPGLFAAYSSLGLMELQLDSEANDAGPNQGAVPLFQLGASLNAVDGIKPGSTLIPYNRAEGVTRALSAPQAGDSIFGGNAAIIDLTGRPNSVTRAGVAQVAMMGYAGAARTGDTRLGAWATLRDYLDEARSYQANPNDYVRRARDARFQLSDLKALGPVVAGEEPLLVFVNSANDIRTLIRLKNTYRLKIIVVGATEGWRVAQELAAANIPVIINGMANLPNSFEDLDSTLKNAARLTQAGVKVSFSDDTHKAYLMRQSAGNAVAEGMPYDAALAAITLNPAAMYGLGDELGSIEAGKIADLVIWDGDPLEVTTEPEAVFIGGRPQDLNTRAKMLMERYRDLSRGDLPHAYRGGE
ncbi:MAG: amidohydrolase family protein [Parvularculaceae bacterium]